MDGWMDGWMDGEGKKGRFNGQEGGDLGPSILAFSPKRADRRWGTSLVTEPPQRISISNGISSNIISSSSSSSSSSNTVKRPCPA